MSRSIDLNSDLGEGFGSWSMGDDDSMLSMVSSANVACGGHAGDTETMFRTLSVAARNGVVAGAHPGYADREGFGRRIIPMTNPEIERLVVAQVGALMAVASLVPIPVRYVKVHGALGNLAARNSEVANAVVRAVQTVDESLALLAISGTEVEAAGRRAGATVYSEIFADRGYQQNGQLVPRGEPGSMIHEAAEASERILEFLETGLMPVVGGDPIPLAADSICVHGDSETAVSMTRRIRRDLLDAGVSLRGFASSSP